MKSFLLRATLALLLTFSAAILFAEVLHTPPTSIAAMKAAMVARNVYVFHGTAQAPTPLNQAQIANLGIIISSAGVIIVDSGTSREHGKKLLDAISKITSQPVVAIFNTHIHGDHWLGNNIIHERFPKAQFYAHKGMIKLARAGVGDDWLGILSQLTDGAVNGTIPFSPSVAVSDGDVISFGDTTIKVVSSSDKAHTATDLIILAERELDEKVIFLGDIGVHHQVGRMDDGSFTRNIEILDQVIALDATIYVPGHGPTSKGSSLTRQYRDYMKTLYAQTEYFYNAGLADFEIKEKILPFFKIESSWEGFETNFGKHVSLVYLEIEENSF
ncbi:MAG: glyoxylase-like metal-dependent hydrolase (beta-lactamase superfamily II) [Glaciecola sp.]|jgi:glyoxylase-like metal-dependent hydrolase (beta-lactamase superfamily II)